MSDQDPQNKDGPADRSGGTSDIEQQISENLRKLYQSTVEEELPEQLRDLLDRLRAQDRQDD